MENRKTITIEIDGKKVTGTAEDMGEIFGFKHNFKPRPTPTKPVVTDAGKSTDQTAGRVL